MSKLREKIDEVDKKIIKFIIAISQKVNNTLNGRTIKFLIETSDGNKKRVQYTLNYSEEDKQFFREWYTWLVDEIEKITLNFSSDWWKDILKYWLLDLIFTRMQYSLEVAKAKKEEWWKKIIVLERRDKMIQDRIDKASKYSQDQDFSDIFMMNLALCNLYIF